MRSHFALFPVGAGSWLLLTAACTAMRTVDRADLSPPNPPSRVWVTRADHSTVALDYPRVSADTLIGIVDGTPERVPLSGATVLRVREPSPDRTAGLVFFGAVGVMALAVHFIDHQEPGPFVCNYICTVRDSGGCCGD